MDELVIGENKYVSSKRAAKITGYAKDYVGQLCREGRIEARLVGRSWYIRESSIRDHRFGAQNLPIGESLPKSKSILPPENHHVVTPTDDFQRAWQEWFAKKQQNRPYNDYIPPVEGDPAPTAPVVEGKAESSPALEELVVEVEAPQAEPERPTIEEKSEAMEELIEEAVPISVIKIENEVHQVPKQEKPVNTAKSNSSQPGKVRKYRVFLPVTAGVIAFLVILIGAGTGVFSGKSAKGLVAATRNFLTGMEIYQSQK